MLISRDFPIGFVLMGFGMMACDCLPDQRLGNVFLAGNAENKGQTDY